MEIYKLLEHGELVTDGDEQWSDFHKKWFSINAWDSDSYHGEYYHSRWDPVRRKISVEIVS